VQRQAFCDALSALKSFSSGAPARTPLGEPSASWSRRPPAFRVSPDLGVLTETLVLTRCRDYFQYADYRAHCSYVDINIAVCCRSLV